MLDSSPTHDYAPLSKRLFAQMFDGFIPLLVIITCVMSASAMRTGGAIALVTAFALSLGYMLFADGLPNGQSMGKRIMRIKVIGESTGAPCSYLQSALRNCTRIFSLFDYIPAFGEKHQRAGDILARTVVVEA